MLTGSPTLLERQPSGPCGQGRGTDGAGFTSVEWGRRSMRWASRGNGRGRGPKHRCWTDRNKKHVECPGWWGQWTWGNKRLGRADEWGEDRMRGSSVQRSEDGGRATERLRLCFSELTVSPPRTSPGAEPPRLPAPNLQAEPSAKPSCELCLRKRVLATAPFSLAGRIP